MIKTWNYSAKKNAYTKAGYTIICLQEDGYVVRFAGQTLFYSRENLPTVQARCDDHAMESDDTTIRLAL